jgi:hypothetical protein
MFIFDKFNMLSGQKPDFLFVFQVIKKAPLGGMKISVK